MAYFIELQMVLGSRHQATRPNSGQDQDVYRDTDEPGEGIPAADAGNPSPNPGERSTPLMVNVDTIRSFYRRQDDRRGDNHIGTRIYFNDGGHVRVTDTIDRVMELVGYQPPAAPQS
jgi:hypothetical protein